jgi:hypothetical protein
MVCLGISVLEVAEPPPPGLSDQEKIRKHIQQKRMRVAKINHATLITAHKAAKDLPLYVRTGVY